MPMRFLALFFGLLVAIPALGAGSVPPLAFDGDADGVPDDRDACPYTPRGIVVGPNGCSTVGDEDEDGVPDAIDACPLSPAGAIVDAQGCALDSDTDGVADGVDACPATPVGVRVDARGCGPGERAVALAPRRPRVAAVAPAVEQAAAPAPVAAPIAPPVAAGVAPDAAPVLSPVVTTAALDRRAEPERTFYFDKRSAKLSRSVSRAIKDTAAALRPELESNPSAGLMVSGHADTKSDGADAPRLAAARATAVRDALIDAGVPPQRVSVRVPGVNEPRFDGANLERNCRVELRVLTRLGTESLPAPTPAATIAAAPPPAAVVKPAQAASPSVPPTTAAPTRDGSTSVAFAPYSAMLDDSAIGTLNRFVQDSTRPLLADAAARVVVISGVDAGETGAAALRLAESRGASVLAYLVSLGLPRNRVELSNDAQTGTRRAELSLVGR